MSPGIIGGLLLILGSYFVYKGDIFKSVGIYFLADLCWVYISYYNDDMMGALSVTIGMIFGILAFFKMNAGTFNKTLRK